MVDGTPVTKVEIPEETPKEVSPWTFHFPAGGLKTKIEYLYEYITPKVLFYGSILDIPTTLVATHDIGATLWDIPATYARLSAGRDIAENRHHSDPGKRNTHDSFDTIVSSVTIPFTIFSSALLKNPDTQGLGIAFGVISAVISRIAFEETHPSAENRVFLKNYI